jgi:hypothetical protein
VPSIFLFGIGLDCRLHVRSIVSVKPCRGGQPDTLSSAVPDSESQTPCFLRVSAIYVAKILGHKRSRFSKCFSATFSTTMADANVRKDAPAGARAGADGCGSAPVETKVKSLDATQEYLAQTAIQCEWVCGSQGGRMYPQKGRTLAYLKAHIAEHLQVPMSNIGLLQDGCILYDTGVKIDTLSSSVIYVYILKQKHSTCCLIC